MWVTNISDVDTEPWYLLHAGSQKILLDYHVSMDLVNFDESPTEYAVFEDFLSPGFDHVLETIDLVVISNVYSFLGLASLFDRIPEDAQIMCTMPTLKLGISMAKSAGSVFDETKFTRIKSRIAIIEFGERLNFRDNIIICAQSAGYPLGACNWIFEFPGKDKLIYVSWPSSVASSISAPFKMSSLLSDCQTCLIVSNLSNNEWPNQKDVLDHIRRDIIRVIDGGGNVLIPLYTVGIIYELIENLLPFLPSDAEGKSRMFCVGAGFEESILQTNIHAESMTYERANRVTQPNLPLSITKNIGDKSLGVVKTIQGLASEVKVFQGERNVVIAEHPSLLFGPARDLLNRWKDDHRNALILVEPGFCGVDLVENAIGEEHKIQCIVHEYDLRLRPFQLVDQMIRIDSLDLVIIPEAHKQAVFNCLEEKNALKKFKNVQFRTSRSDNDGIKLFETKLIDVTVDDEIVNSLQILPINSVICPGKLSGSFLKARIYAAEGAWRMGKKEKIQRNPFAGRLHYPKHDLSAINSLDIIKKISERNRFGSRLNVRICRQNSEAQIAYKGGDAGLITIFPDQNRISVRCDDPQLRKSIKQALALVFAKISSVQAEK